MKKLLLLLLPLLALSFNACSDKDDDNPTENKLTINGKNYDLSGGSMHYYGSNENEDAINVDLVLRATNGAYLELEMFVSNGNTKLVAGTYNLNPNFKEFTYSDSYAVDENDNDFEITGGTIKVAVSGDTYTITINCNLKGGGTAKGEYKGSLTWSDDSE